MQLLRRLPTIIALALLVAACATPAGTPSGASPATTPPSPAATGADPTAAGPSTAALSLEGLGGTWTFVASNPRVVAATGDHQGGSVTIIGDRVRFTAGEYISEGPVQFSGTKDVTCSATSCRFFGVPLDHLFLVDDQLAILNAATLSPLGSFGGACFEDVPDGGIVTVLSTGTVAGQEVPTEVRFTDGTATGFGTACEDGSHTLAWDVTATREP